MIERFGFEYALWGKGGVICMFWVDELVTIRPSWGYIMVWGKDIDRVELEGTNYEVGMISGLEKSSSS